MVKSIGDVCELDKTDKTHQVINSKRLKNKFKKYIYQT